MDLYFKISNLTDKSKLNIIDQQISDNQKKNTAVLKATQSESITYITRPFGRGTDFMSLDERVNKAGGIVVIITFLPQTLSEEIQIKGRTARQSTPGIAHIIINQQELNMKPWKLTNEMLEQGVK